MNYIIIEHDRKNNNLIKILRCNYYIFIDKKSLKKNRTKY